MRKAESFAFEKSRGRRLHFFIVDRTKLFPLLDAQKLSSMLVKIKRGERGVGGREGLKRHPGFLITGVFVR